MWWRFRMCGVIPLLPQSTAWCGAKLSASITLHCHCPGFTQNSGGKPRYRVQACQTQGPHSCMFCSAHILISVKFSCPIRTQEQALLWNLHGCTMYQWYQTLYCPTNAHNVINIELLKHFKLMGLLQHVSVYKETIIRKPQPVLS
jgi:hypothetical protein